MLNAVGREIPDEILEITGKEPFQGNNYKEGVEYRKQGPIVKPVIDHNTSKMVASIREALEKCGAHDGMTLGFHHHFREGDLVVNMVMKEVHDMGIKDVTICASSLGKAHDPLIEYIEDGTITRIESSGVRGKIGDTISHGKCAPMEDVYVQSRVEKLRSIFPLSGHLPAMIMETVKELAERVIVVFCRILLLTDSMQTR